MKPMVNIVVFIIRFIENMFGSCDIGLKNKITDSVFIIKMFEYSARKNRANIPLAYSTLKPDTSSDSPSVRSKGVRFVSASVETNHIIASGQDISTSHVFSWVFKNSCIV